MLDHYILVNGRIKKADMMEWARWFQDINNRIIDRTEISGLPTYPGGGYISTVFIGIDHNFDFSNEDEFNLELEFTKHKIMCFETMIFGGKFDQHCWRTCTMAEAKKVHWDIVSALREGEFTEESVEGQPSIMNYFKEIFGSSDEDDEDEDENWVSEDDLEELE